jgi:hypothetical protein
MNGRLDGPESWFGFGGVSAEFRTLDCLFRSLIVMLTTVTSIVINHIKYLKETSVGMYTTLNVKGGSV